MSEGRQSGLVPDGPRLVAIGGGHGLSRTLRAARHIASSLTAIVSVADDGGSSGRLREAFGIPAPGDLRKSIGALLPGRSPLGDALEHRFVGGELDGHAFGNLLIAALAETMGDFVAAVDEACKLLGTVGTVYPATDAPVVLRAETATDELSGQVTIMGTAGVLNVALEPAGVGVPSGALAAIAAADAIVLGPGSLYTSVLAALATEAMQKAVHESPALLIYVANLREQVPETAGYDVADHVAALNAHGITPEVLIADPSAIALGRLPGDLVVIQAELAGENPYEHDEARLANVLARAMKVGRKAHNG